LELNKTKKNTMKYINLIIGLFLAVTISAQETGSLLIKNGTVITITDGVKENTDVLIQNGKIKQIGTNLSAGNGVTTIDADGQYVMPGIVDAHSHIGISVVNEATNPVTAEVFD